MRLFYLLILATSIIGFTNCAGDTKEKKNNNKNEKVRINDNSSTSGLLNLDYFGSPAMITRKKTNFGSETLQIGDYKAKIDSLVRFELKFITLGPNIYSLKYNGIETDLCI